LHIKEQLLKRIDEGLLNMLIRKLEAADLDGVVAVHKTSYPKGHLTSFFPASMLKDYYASMVSDINIALVAVSTENQVLGFVIGGNEVKKDFKKFITNNIYGLTMVSIRNPVSAVSYLLNFLKPGRRVASKAKTRLLSIAVSSSQQGTGIGHKLIKAFEDILSSRNVYFYGLSVKKDNQSAKKFYDRAGFVIEFETSDGLYYYKKITAE